MMMRLVLGALASLVLLSQYTTMVKLQPLSASVSYLHMGSYLRAVRDQAALGPGDALLLGLIVVMCIAVALLERSGAHLTKFLRTVFASERATLGLLLASSVVFVRYYLAPGEFNWAADSSQHIAYADITARAMATGELPFWTFYLGTGSPYLQFYGFVFFWLAGAVNLLVGDTYTTLKLVLAGCHVLSGAGAYAAARAGGCRRSAAFVAGIAFVLCFWHAQHVLIMGRLQLSIVYALLPWPFWALESSLRCTDLHKRYARVLFGGAILGLLILSHPGFGYWTSAFIGLYGLARFVGHGERPGMVTAGVPLIVLAVGLVVGAGLVLPMWLDKGYTGLAGAYSLVGTPDPSWWHVLVWSNFRFWLWLPDAIEFNWYGGYLGLSLIGLATVGATTAIFQRRRTPAALAAAVCLLGGLVMVFGYRTALVKLLPNSEILGAGRYLLFVSFFLAISAGHGVRWLQLKVRRRVGTRPGAWHRVSSLAVLLVVADLGPTTFQQVFRDAGSTVDATGASHEFHDQMLNRARQFETRGELPDYRTLWARSSMHRFLGTGLVYFNTRTPVPDGPHPGELHAVFRFVRPFERLVDTSVSRGLRTDGTQFDIDPIVSAGLSLLNVRFLLAYSAESRMILLEVPHPSPIHVSSRLSPPPTPSSTALGRMLRMDLDHLLTSDPRDVAGMTQVITWLQAMDVDTRTGACGTFFVDELSVPADLGTTPTVQVLRHNVRNEHVDLQVETTARGYARLAYGYYPHMRVLVDGQPVPVRSTADGFVLIELDSGVHSIELQPQLSALRTTLLWLSLLIIAAAAGNWIRMRR